MPLLSLEIGLVLRRGARTLEFLRLLPGNKVQFEDQLTKQVQTWTLSHLSNALLTKQLVPVLLAEPLGADVGEQPPKVNVLTDLSSLGDKYFNQVRRRMAYVRAMRRAQITRGQREAVNIQITRVAARIKDAKPPSASSVMEWMRDFELSGDNPASLITGNYARRRPRLVHPVVEELIERCMRNIYLQPSRPTLLHTLLMINVEMRKLRLAGKVEENTPDVTYSTLSRRKGEIDPYVVDKSRYGVSYARSKFRTSFSGTEASRSLERLECDHTLLNWVVVCDVTGLPLGRPTLTVVIDSFSGYVVGFYVSFHGPGVASVLNVIKNAICPKDEYTRAAQTKKPWIAFGVGETLLLDNGMEFHSKDFLAATWELCIDVEYCRVRTPWLKPKVERFFLNLDFLSLAKGRVWKSKPNGDRLDPKKDAAIAFSDFLRGLTMFIVDVYPFQENSRTLAIPFEKFEEGLLGMPPPLLPTSLDSLDLIAAKRSKLTVGPGGVETIGLAYSSRELLAMKKRVGSSFKTEVKWCLDDISFAYVQNPMDHNWLVVPSVNPEYTKGLSWLQHKLIRQQAKQDRLNKGHADHLMKAKEALHELWMNCLAKTNRKTDPAVMAKYSGMSSASFARGEAQGVPRAASSVRSDDELKVEESEIPKYESFQMN